MTTQRVQVLTWRSFVQLSTFLFVLYACAERTPQVNSIEVSLQRLLVTRFHILFKSKSQSLRYSLNIKQDALMLLCYALMLCMKNMTTAACL